MESIEVDINIPKFIKQGEQYLCFVVSSRLIGYLLFDVVRLTKSTVVFYNHELEIERKLPKGIS